MNQRTLLMIGGGCLVVLCLCGVCALGAWFFLPGQINQITAQLGLPDVTNGAPVIAPVAATQAPLVPGVVPTSAAVPGSATRAAAPSSGGNLLNDWINKAKTAQKYRCEVSWTFSSTKAGKVVDEPFLDMSGEVDGQNEHFTMKAGVFSALTGGNNPLETMEVDGKSYWKGVNMFGTTDPKQWYIQKDSGAASGFADFCKPDQWNSFTSSGSDFKKVRSEVLDNQPCDVYFYDMKSLQNQAIVGMFGSAQDRSNMSAIDKAEINVWACADGFVHKYTLEYAGHNEKNAAEKGGMKMNWHAFDFNNAAIKITAPAGAKPMPGQ